MLEVDELHVAGGKQDQYAAALGGVNYLEFKDPYVSSSPLRLTDSTINEMEKRLILCYTGHARLSGNIISAVTGAYRARNDRTVRALHRMVGIADEMRGALLRGEVDALGPLLLENWACQKDLHPSVTNADIEHLFDVALAHGATGGKALGAGGGGCLLFLAIADREHEVRARCSRGRRDHALQPGSPGPAGLGSECSAIRTEFTAENAEDAEVPCSSQRSLRLLG